MGISNLIDPSHKEGLHKFMLDRFAIPKLKNKPKILVEPMSKSYGLVGTSFEELLKVVMASMNPNFDRKNGKVSKIDSQNLKIALKLKEANLHSGYTKALSYRIKQEKNALNSLMRDGMITTDLIESCFFKGLCDLFEKSRELPTNLIDFDKVILEELSRLLKIVPRDFLHSKSKIITSPDFGKASIDVGGATGDLILGTTLIEVKTVKELKFDRSYLHQLLSYYALSMIGGVGDFRNSKKFKIEFLAIYFARHGFLWKVALEEIGDKRAFDELIDWFRQYIDRVGANRHLRGASEVDSDQLISKAIKL
jgi:hypothetical protein